MAMDAGVKVKFIETQFISSDAASFKAVVQRLTGKSPPPASSSHPAQAPQPQRPRPCRPAPFVNVGAGQQPPAAGWTTDQHAARYLMAMPAPKQEPLAAVPRLGDMHDDLCDFADLFYYTTAAGARCDGGTAGAFPY